MSESSRNRIHSVELPLDANQGSVSLGLSERKFNLRCNSCEGLSFSSAQFSPVFLWAGPL